MEIDAPGLIKSDDHPNDYLKPCHPNCNVDDSFRLVWHLPMLVVTAINFVIILSFEVYLICCVVQSFLLSPLLTRRHLFLGQMLMLGLLLGSVVALVVALKPHLVNCSIVYMGSGLAYAFIYDSLLVKLVILISTDSGVYLPSSYQALLFLFIVLVQFVISIKWIMEALFSSSYQSICRHAEPWYFVASLSYVVFLFLFVAILAIKTRHIRDNYSEAKHICLLIIISVPIWFLWLTTFLTLDISLRPLSLGLGLVSCVMVTFLVMFIPKNRQLSAMGKDGIYFLDQECNDVFSLHDGYQRYPSPRNQYYRINNVRKKIASKGSKNKQGGSTENSYAGFHRPLQVVPPTPAGGRHLIPPTNPLYFPVISPEIDISTKSTSYFPSHFYPANLNHYWQFYTPWIQPSNNHRYTFYGSRSGNHLYNKSVEVNQQNIYAPIKRRDRITNNYQRDKNPYY